MPDVTLPHHDIRFDQGRHYRAKIGFVLLATEQTIEDDMMALRPPGVGMHFTRAPMPDAVTAANLAAQADSLAGRAALLLADGSLNVVCYACTSGSLVIGEQRVTVELRKGAPQAKATSLISGVIRGLRAVGARKLVVATPYLDEINRAEAAYLKHAGFEILAISGLNLTKDSDMVRVAPDYIAEFALSCDRDDADAIFISCGALRSLDVLQKIEEIAGKPVIASNQAMLWDTLRLAGVEDRIPGYGCLLTAH